MEGMQPGSSSNGTAAAVEAEAAAAAVAEATAKSRARGGIISKVADCRCPPPPGSVQTLQQAMIQQQGGPLPSKDEKVCGSWNRVGTDPSRTFNQAS
mmetsp:Transcript_32196/g.68937  ORF Transcript_32196/g.68937 Transcript_32196/m.68937 type:complete len:97 (+) Transcript_32196:165-455(+)